MTLFKEKINKKFCIFYFIEKNIRCCITVDILWTSDFGMFNASKCIKMRTGLQLFHFVVNVP